MFVTSVLTKVFCLISHLLLTIANSTSFLFQAEI